MVSYGQSGLDSLKRMTIVLKEKLPLCQAIAAYYYKWLFWANFRIEDL
jgi:hypothetical protein